jgi:hypothetical protein
MDIPDKGAAEVAYRNTLQYARERAKELLKKEEREAQKQEKQETVSITQEMKEKEAKFELPLIVDSMRRVKMVVKLNENGDEMALTGAITRITPREVTLLGEFSNELSRVYRVVRKAIAGIFPALERQRPTVERDTDRLPCQDNDLER